MNPNVGKVNCSSLQDVDHHSHPVATHPLLDIFIKVHASVFFKFFINRWKSHDYDYSIGFVIDI